jgi:hypothetical protein
MMLFDEDLPVMKIECKNYVRIVMNVNHECQENFFVVVFRCCMYCKISCTKIRAPQVSPLG